MPKWISLLLRLATGLALLLSGCPAADPVPEYGAPPTERDARVITTDFHYSPGCSVLASALPSGDQVASAVRINGR